MKETLPKRWVRQLFFRDGAVRTIRFGPLRGYKYKVSKATGMSAWYSGPEHEQHRVLSQLIAHGDVIMDIGANWGLHTMFFSDRVGKSGRVIALEPFPAIAAELEWHVQHNQCGNVQIVNAAVSTQDGEAEFTLGDSAFTGSLVASPSLGKKIRVRVRSVDSLARELKLDSLALMKIDVEGAESAVFEGAEETIRKFRPNILVELHTPEQDVQVAGWLLSRKYSVARVGPPPIQDFTKPWPAPEGVWGTLIARPS